MLLGFNTSLFSFLYRGIKQDTITCDISLNLVDVLEKNSIFPSMKVDFKGPLYN